MAYLIYALTHKGQYRVYGDAYLFRGYEDIIAKINSLGGKITLEKE
jgi:UDP-N-acetylglucosamine enolpyruvyl transferase